MGNSREVYLNKLYSWPWLISSQRQKSCCYLVYSLFAITPIMCVGDGDGDEDGWRWRGVEVDC